jgi:organic radical activating enzyme
MEQNLSTSAVSDSSTARILEIFNSVQGEGKYAGVRQVFVRFYACNIHCIWCDTPHSIGDTTQKYIEIDLDELMRKVSDAKDGCHSVSLTGGEPLLQQSFIKKLAPRLKEQGLPVYLDTNGTLPHELAEVINDVDIIAMDIKLPSSTKCAPFWKEHEEFLKIAKQKDLFIKTVISLDTDLDELMRAAELVAAVDSNVLFILQPNSFEIGQGVVKKCMSFQDHCVRRLNDVRVIPQMHRYLKVR